MSLSKWLSKSIILFEGGLDLNLRHVVRQAGRAVFLGTISFITAMLLVYILPRLCQLPLNSGSTTGRNIDSETKYRLAIHFPDVIFIPFPSTPTCFN